MTQSAKWFRDIFLKLSACSCYYGSTTCFYRFRCIAYRDIPQPLERVLSGKISNSKYSSLGNRSCWQKDCSWIKKFWRWVSEGIATSSRLLRLYLGVTLFREMGYFHSQPAPGRHQACLRDGKYSGTQGLRYENNILIIPEQTSHVQGRKEGGKERGQPLIPSFPPHERCGNEFDWPSSRKV